MSAIFKKGPFDISTVFSTPCDISFEGTKKLNKSLI